MDVLLGILIPFIGTTLGAALVFFMKNKINKKVEKVLYGFASGIMIAASIWSLLIPAIELSEQGGKIAFIPPAVGFLIGIFSLLFLDKFTNYLEKKNEKEEKNITKKSKMLMFAVTIHNIPEGMAVGVIFAGFLAGNSGITLAGAFALSLGIAIQNFPEGAIISMPLKSEGYSKCKSFILGTLSGIVEPIGALITICLTSLIVPILPYLLAFAAGAMIYVVVEELIPEAKNEINTSLSTIGVAFGFVIMMMLDVALG